MDVRAPVRMGTDEKGEHRKPPQPPSLPPPIEARPHAQPTRRALAQARMGRGEQSEPRPRLRWITASICYFFKHDERLRSTVEIGLSQKEVLFTANTLSLSLALSRPP